MMETAGKTALITGGTKGIGFGIAKVLLDHGMNVLITGRSEGNVREALEKLRSGHPDSVEGVAADVRKPGDQKNAVDTAIKAFGQLDLLVANAGLGHFASIEELTSDQWNETIDINLTGVFNSIKPAIEPLKKSRGMIITIASLAGTNFFAGGSAYNASKFGLVGFTQAVMLDLRKYGVRVSTIMPGSVATHFNHPTAAADQSWKIQPEDIGRLVAELMAMDPRTLPSKIEVRPSMPPSK